MKIPLDESKELVHVQLDSGLISSDMVVFDYSISYEVPQELNARTLDKDQHPENYTAEEAEKIQAEYNSYHENGYVGFDHEGNILFRQTDEGANRSDFFVGPNGELLKLSRPYDEEARKFHTFICEVQRAADPMRERLLFHSALSSHFVENITMMYIGEELILRKCDYFLN